jgi:predicted amidohydrolase
MRVLAAAQTLPIRGEVDANLAEHLRLARAAAEARAQVVVFPELSLTGYELDLMDELAFSEHDARLAPLVDLAVSRRMLMIVGAPVRIASRLYLGAFVLSADGALDVYTKHHLGAFSPGDNPDGAVPPPEKSVFAPGERNPLVRFGGHTGAVAVCADTGQPAHPRQAAGRGAKSYLASMFVIPRYLDPETANLASYAARYAMAVVFANFGAASGGLPSGGSSAIWSDRGERVVQLPKAGSGVAVAIESGGGWSSETLALA